jgi:hypothetical protein
MCGWKLYLHPKHLGVRWEWGKLHCFLKSPHYPICQEAMHAFLVRATCKRCVCVCVCRGGNWGSCWEAAKKWVSFSSLSLLWPLNPQSREARTMLQCDCAEEWLRRYWIFLNRFQYLLLIRTSSQENCKQNRKFQNNSQRLRRGQISELVPSKKDF